MYWDRTYQGDEQPQSQPPRLRYSKVDGVERILVRLAQCRPETQGVAHTDAECMRANSLRTQDLSRVQDLSDTRMCRITDRLQTNVQSQ